MRAALVHAMIYKLLESYDALTPAQVLQAVVENLPRINGIVMNLLVPPVEILPAPEKAAVVEGPAVPVLPTDV